MLKRRSQLLQQLRAFFYARKVVEVDVPILSPYATPDAHLDSLQTTVELPGMGVPQNGFLHTSPEYPLKRLLAEGAGDLFYLGKVFRNGDHSSRHQPEFTMLEWYRLGFELSDLIDETVDLCQAVLAQTAPLPVEVVTYQSLFQKVVGIENIHQASAATCQAAYQQLGLPEVMGVAVDDKVLWEQLLLTEAIEPHLGWTENGERQITCVVEFPKHIASLAQPVKGQPDLVQRVEVYIEGIELANGYFELQQAEDYQAVFEQELAERKKLSKSPVPIDIQLLETLKQHPLPKCSGIALGVDRLLMLQQGVKEIAQVMPFILEGE